MSRLVGLMVVAAIGGWSVASCGGDDGERRPPADSDVGQDASGDASADVGDDVARDTEDPDVPERDAREDADPVEPRCGDGVLSATEECEAFDLRGQRCTDLGFESGRLTCSPTCTLDTSLCVRCGDGVVGGSEVCDGSVDTAITCAMVRGPGSTGTLRCAEDCSAIIDDDCVDPTVDAEFAPCDPAAPSCDEGLTCEGSFAGPICVETCSEADDCDGASFCASLGEGTRTCLPRVSEGYECDEDAPCAGELACVPAFLRDDGTNASLCARECDECEEGESCVDAPSGAFEVVGDVRCDPLAPTSCPEGDSCVDVDPGREEEFRCTRPRRLCATQQELYGFVEGGPTDTHLCDITGPTGGGRFCGASLEEGAATVECYPVFGEGEPLGACVGLCDDGSLGGRSDRTCPSGFTCTLPPLAGLYLPQTGSAPATCTDEDRSACGEGFPACVDFGDGPVCARPARICTPAE